MTDKFIPTQNSFTLSCTNVWTKVADWTEWQCLANVKLFDLTVSSIEIDQHLVDRFHRAAWKGDVSLVESLLQEGVPVDCVNRVDQTPLFSAAQLNRTDVIRLLLQKGANVNKRGGYGDTALHWAAYGDSPEAIAMLIEHGASINITDDDGEKPIDTARRYEKEAAVRMLEQL